MSLREWRKTRLDRYRISQYFYFSLIDNLESILKYGILPHNEVVRRGLEYKSFSMTEVQMRRHRRNIHVSNGMVCNIHDLVPLYLTPKTPTLYKRKHMQDKIFFCVVQSYILLDNNIAFAFCDGNAASSSTRYYYDLNKLSCIDWDVIRSDSWDAYPDGKRKRCAEVLVYPRVPVQRIWNFVVNNDNAKRFIERKLYGSGLDITVKLINSYFFQN